ncbi:MAG TPA: hypothetical protein DEH78_28800 [Solibacterales bacterium]|nr:hypothetical protein [Bryobacterales bacterium]
MMKYLPRRTFLRGLGTTLALPLLDAMTPAFAKTKGPAPLRMAFVYVPNGIHMPYFTPAAEGKAFELPRILAPLTPHRGDFLVLSGLTHHNGRALGDGPGDHARAAASYLTGVHPRKTAGADIRNGPSVDQIAAQHVGKATRFASLELGCEDGRLVGNCDSGYSCAYSNSLSWRSESTPMPPETNPRSVFERLFGNADFSESAEARARRQRYNKSILDFVTEDAKSLKASLGPTDQRKLDEYLHGVREIERRLQAAEQQSAIVPTLDKPSGVPVEYEAYVKIMMDLMAVAFQADLTRVSTLMMAREGSNRAYREIGVSDGHHGLSHHMNNPEWIEKIAKINVFHMELFACMLEKFKSVKDGDGTLLDNTMLVYGSGLSDGNRHWHHDLPVIAAGRGKGNFHPGRHVRYPKDTPMTNLFVTMLDRMGVPEEKIGDSTGRLEQLSEL